MRVNKQAVESLRTFEQSRKAKAVVQAVKRNGRALSKEDVRQLSCAYQDAYRSAQMSQERAEAEQLLRLRNKATDKQLARMRKPARKRV